MPEELRRDGLTGFFVREELVLFLARLMAGAGEGEKGFSIALIDIDHFKKFNDKHGHLFGDEILKYATSTLRLTFYEGQCSFFRYGGDEFIAVFPGKDPKEAQGLIRQCHTNLFRRPCLSGNKLYRVMISCGIAGFPSDAKTPEELIQKADEAMYFSKRNGRNTTTVLGKIPYLRLRKTFMQIGGLFFWPLPLSLCITSRLKKSSNRPWGKLKRSRSSPSLTILILLF